MSFGASFCAAILIGCSDKNPSPTKEGGESPASVRQEEAMKLPIQAVQERHEYLEVQLTNNSGGLIEQTSISFGSNQCTFGILGSGGSKSYLGWIKAVGTKAMVRWRDGQKTPRMATADFSLVYDPTKPGILSFAIAGTNVTVTFTQIDRK